MEETTASWHSLEIENVVDILNTNLHEGLTSQEVNERQRQFGLNRLPKKKRVSFLTIFIHQFKSPLIYLLLIAALTAFLIGERVDALVIVTVLLINALIGGYQESRAEISMEALLKLSRTKARVLRDKREQLIDSDELVPGDIMIVSEGDLVGADARLFTSSSLQATEASLTGESMPILKSAASLAPDTHLAERTNMLFSGTHIARGKGKAIVVETGINTEIGKISVLALSAKKIPTPLEQKIAVFSKLVLLAALFVFISVIFIGFIQDLTFTEIFMVSLSQVVSMVPEGLPVAMTVALAVGMQRMASRRAIVRKIDAVETLGATNVVCTDKTGTLTRNEMTVTSVVLPEGRSISVGGVGFDPTGTFSEENAVIDPSKNYGLLELFHAAALCNDALYHFNPETSSWEVGGDPTEISLLSFALKGNVDPEPIRKSFDRINEIPFDSETKMMAVHVKSANKEKIYLKGAPEAILGLCSICLIGEETKPLDQKILRKLTEQHANLAQNALRMISFAVIDNPSADLSGGWESLRGTACYLGTTGQFDPPRLEVKDAVTSCHLAGIRPVMVTGDHKITAFAVAKMLGIAEEGDLVIEGEELSDLSETELLSKIEKVSVFARVLPGQKLQIVDAFQKINKTVAMTGDGVNDAPALAKADVGVAMGITGTDVAKESAKIVITDDNFATIIHAVEEGRIVFRNLRKLILYLVSTSLTELTVLYTALIFGFPLPLAAVQILWINLVTDGALSVSLILEPGEGDEMRSPPVARTSPLIGWDLIKRMALLVPAMAISTFGYFLYRLHSGMPFPQVQTGTFTVLAVCQWMNALNCRSEHRSAFRGFFKNQWVLIGLVIGNILHLAVVFLPPLNLLFHTTPIPLSEVFVIGSASSLVLIVEEIRKWMKRRRKRIRNL